MLSVLSVLFMWKRAGEENGRKEREKRPLVSSGTNERLNGAGKETGRNGRAKNERLKGERREEETSGRNERAKRAEKLVV